LTRGYFLCVKKKGRREGTHAGGVISGSENGNLKKFSSHYFYFLNEVKQMKSSGRASVKRRREM
jgi:predicted nucleic acid-binding Zn finger protein